MSGFAHSEIYQVLVRRKPEGELQLIGAVHAPTHELAMLYAAWTYDEETWAELQVVRRDGSREAAFSVSSSQAAEAKEKGAVS
ncbi:MAG: hypothetical protein IMW90_13790 [Thermogemmatispora sp.]|jgi:1,2-phenylacetyl-CoA epoxidase PaaB subunit|uniref:hypothetical protein n=1 Tax=Thermogemmatispora sp. TaxID=1968838 RepID=UPI001A06C5EF|nr:hypothetical protein [Thermogemmatispora sp.]MBE3566791.1 hypothetical protein [Thermogemmatispora sp.]